MIEEKFNPVVIRVLTQNIRRDDLLYFRNMEGVLNVSHTHHGNQRVVILHIKDDKRITLRYDEKITVMRLQP